MGRVRTAVKDIVRHVHPINLESMEYKEIQQHRKQQQSYILKFKISFFL